MSNKLKDYIDETTLQTNEEKSNAIEINEELKELTQTVETDKTSEDIAKPIADNISTEESPNSTEVQKKEKEEIKYTPLGNAKSKEHSPKKSSYIVIVLILFCLIFLIGIFSTVFAFLNIGSTKIISGISINGIDVSGLTSKEATEKVSNILSEQLNTALNLTYQDYTTTLIPSQEIDALYDIATAVEKAYLLGRSDNIFKNNLEIVYTYLAKNKIEMELQYSEEKLASVVNNIALEVPGLVEQPSYYIENTELIILPGKEGLKLLQDETKNLIIETINISSSFNIELPVIIVSPDKIDIQKIYSEIHTEPQNAYLVQDPFEIFVGSAGTDFAITIEAAQNLLQEEKEEYVIPLKITEAEIGVEDLGDGIFVDTLSTYTSKYDESNVNRSTNVKIAASKLNNVILLPGETLSYNQTVGERTISNGFKEASIYTSKGVEYGLGGGICQVSSTLYNAVLEANLGIVERKNHRYAVTYVPNGRDATVAYGSIDFKFKNTRKYPIKLVASAKNGICSISVKGIKEEVEYNVTVTTKKLQTTPFETKYINDSSLAKGTQVVKQHGYYGYKYETYKVLSLNGSVVSTTLLSTDTYTPLAKIVRIGTKE